MARWIVLLTLCGGLVDAGRLPSLAQEAQQEPQQAQPQQPPSPRADTPTFRARTTLIEFTIVAVDGRGLLAYPGVPAIWSVPDLTTVVPPVLPVTFRHGTERFAYFSTVTVLGTPQDITLQELRIESFFPVDEATKAAARALRAAG